MKNDIFKTMFFSGLYPTEEQVKIDLCSRDFYRDALDFYRSKANEYQRTDLIAGIKFLSAQIRTHDELTLATDEWKSCTTSMNVKEIFAGVIAVRKSKLNLVTQFRDNVGLILENRKVWLDNKKARLDDRKKKELENLREKSENDKVLIDSLIIANQNNARATLVPGKVDFTILLLNIKKDRDDVTRNKAEDFFSQLNESRSDPKKVNGKEFTAIASMFYNTGWIVKNKSFAKWLRALSEFYDRPIPTYKETQVKDCIEDLKRKAPFLEKLPFV